MRAPGDVSSLARTSLDGAVGSLKLNEDGAPVDPPSADDKTLLEHALCRVIFSLIEDASASSTAFMSHVASGAKKGANAPSMPRLLDLALEMSETGIVEAACVFNALEQLVETCTIADCTDVFTWVESKRIRLRSESLWRRGKLVMLRTCNELQRRLSKTADTVLRGRVLLLLSSLYPLSERSALNLGGNYNVGNTVELDTRHFNADTAKESGKKGGDGTEDGVVVDGAFYETFWSLQKFFGNPPEALESPTGWNDFVKSLSAVLDNFETHRLDKTAGASGTAPDHSIDPDVGTKYLTAAPLLHLQLRDPSFRRHFLLQCAVFLGFCTAPLYKGVDAKAAKAVNKRVMAAIRQTPPLGDSFADAVALAMRREEGWVLWKRENCKDFERVAEAPKPPPLPAPAMRKRPRPGAATSSVPPERRVRLGNPELDRLWNLSEDNAGALGDKKDAAPTARDYLQNVIDDMDPEAQIEEAYKSKNDKTYAWKALRLIAKADMGAFQRLGAEDLEKVVPAMLGVEPPGKPAEEDGGAGEATAMETGGEEEAKEEEAKEEEAKEEEPEAGEEEEEEEEEEEGDDDEEDDDDEAEEEGEEEGEEEEEEGEEEGEA